MTEWQIVFLAVMAVALVVMATIQVGMIARGRASRRAGGGHRRGAPPRGQAAHRRRPIASPMTRRASRRSRLAQVERVDRLLESTAARVDETLGDRAERRRRAGAAGRGGRGGGPGGASPPSAPGGPSRPRTHATTKTRSSWAERQTADLACARVIETACIRALTCARRIVLARGRWRPSPPDRRRRCALRSPPPAASTAKAKELVALLQAKKLEAVRRARSGRGRPLRRRAARARTCSCWSSSATYARPTRHRVLPVPQGLHERVHGPQLVGAVRQDRSSSRTRCTTA